MCCRGRDTGFEETATAVTWACGQSFTGCEETEADRSTSCFLGLVIENSIESWEHWENSTAGHFKATRVSYYDLIDLSMPPADEFGYFE
jgi:hypothetical protein